MLFQYVYVVDYYYIISQLRLFIVSSSEFKDQGFVRKIKYEETRSISTQILSLVLLEKAMQFCLFNESLIIKIYR